MTKSCAESQNRAMTRWFSERNAVLIAVFAISMTSSQPLRAQLTINLNSHEDSFRTAGLTEDEISNVEFGFSQAVNHRASRPRCHWRGA